jgi:hypothetical protein
MLGYDKLMNHYKTNFSLMQHHKYSLHELESMMPWERFIYIDLLKDYIKEQEQKARDTQAAKVNASKAVRK